MDLRILEIASNTKNHKVLKKHTHQSRNKNPLCGDEMEISLIVKDNIVQDMGYQCRSCVYCQASVSLLSRWVMQVPIEKISDFVLNAELFFDKNFDQLKKIRNEIEGHIKKSDDFDNSVGVAVRVEKFSDSSIDMRVRCFTTSNSFSTWLEVKEKLAIEIKQIVEGNKAAFAFPSQSIYIEKK